MQRVGIAELKDRLSEHIRAVERGGEVEVTDRGRPVARISRLPASHAPIVTPPLRPFGEVRDRLRPHARWSTDSTALLLEERGER